MTPKKFLLSCASLCLSATFGWAGGIHTSIKVSDVPQNKRTSLDQYLSSHDARDLMVQDKNILFIDVRDPVEVSQSGHPEFIDAIIPVRVQSEQFDPALNEHVLVDFPEFMPEMRALLSKSGKSRHDLIIITCGSGVRSAYAAEKLISAGFTNVWHIVDGYVGDDKVGINTHNAWQLAGLPWSHSPSAEAVWTKVIAVD